MEALPVPGSGVEVIGKFADPPLVAEAPRQCL